MSLPLSQPKCFKVGSKPKKMVEIAVLAIQKNSVFHDKCGAAKARKSARVVTRDVILIEAIDTSNTTALCSQPSVVSVGSKQYYNSSFSQHILI